MLSGMRVMTRGEGDCNVVKSRNGSVQADFLAWKVKFLNRLQALAKGEKKRCSGNCKTGGSCKNKRRDTQEEEKEEEEEKAALKNNSSEVKTEEQSLFHWCVFNDMLNIFTFGAVGWLGS